MQKRYLDPMTGHGPFGLDSDAAQPNILLISTDMVPPEFYLPGPGPHTPNLAALRDRHLFFANAWCTSPLCSPSRASYITGRYSYITTNSERAHDGHQTHLRPDDIIFPEYLKAAGYHLRHIGKCHAGAQKFGEVFSENDSPWDRWSPPWNDDDAYLRFLRNKGLGRFSFEREISGRSLTGKGKGNSYGGWIAPQNGNPFPKDATYPAYLVERAMDALEDRPDADQPFYLQLDFFGPHQPFAIPAGMEEREREIRATMHLPASYEKLAADDFKTATPEPRVYSLYRRNWGLDDAQTGLDYRVANQLQFELIDEFLGRLYGYLREKNLYDNTWIFFIADHGEMNVENALIDKGAYLHPRVVRAPIIAKPPAASPLAHRQDTVTTPTSLLDLAPTVLEIAGISTEARLDGVSLLRALTGEQRPRTNPVLFEVWSHVIPNPCVGTIFTAADGGEYLFSFNASDPEDELYRLDGSLCPDNLWNDPDYEAVRDEAIVVMHRRLAADERWKSYRGFLELTYPERLEAAAGDRQLFF
jgi:arylsulfatase A-like enzyme